MKVLFIALFVGTCCFLSACKGHNNIQQHKETVAVKTDRIFRQRSRGEKTVPSTLVRTASGESHFFDEEIDRLIQQNTKFQLELADLGATSEAVVYKNLGVSYLEQGKLDKAVVAFRKAVQIAPRFIEAHYLLADVYSVKGEGLLSRTFLEKAMALEGSYIIDTRVTEKRIPSPPQYIFLAPEFLQGPIKRMDAPQR
jgi:tetratricopeptide (TPR) repeat protein